MNSFFIKSIKNSKIAQQYLLSYVLLIIIFVSYIYYRKNQNEYYYSKKIKAVISEENTSRILYIGSKYTSYGIEYTVNNKKYKKKEATPLFFGIGKIGDEVEIYYNEDDPTQSSFKSSTDIYVCITFLCIILFIFLRFIYCFLDSKKYKSCKKIDSSSSNTYQGDGDNAIIEIIFLCIITIFSGITYP